MNPWTILPALAALALGYILLPVGLTALARYRRQLNLRCPESGEEAGLYFEARRAAVSACFGRPSLRVRNCSLWPEKGECARRCESVPECEMREARRAFAA